jgi:hypothetical protein
LTNFSLSSHNCLARVSSWANLDVLATYKKQLIMIDKQINQFITLQSLKYCPVTPPTSADVAKWIVVCAPSLEVWKVNFLAYSALLPTLYFIGSSKVGDNNFIKHIVAIRGKGNTNHDLGFN